jgi:hypothetical protein
MTFYQPTVTVTVNKVSASVWILNVPQRPMHWRFGFLLGAIGKWWNFEEAGLVGGLKTLAPLLPLFCLLVTG